MIFCDLSRSSRTSQVRSDSGTKLHGCTSLLHPSKLSEERIHGGRRRRRAGGHENWFVLAGLPFSHRVNLPRGCSVSLCVTRQGQEDCNAYHGTALIVQLL
jgi:hypothetical protein